MAPAPLPEFFRGTSQALRSEAGALALGAGLIEALASLHHKGFATTAIKAQPQKGECIMSKVRFTLNMLAVALFVMTVSSMANAQATRTWVSGVGDDVNPCSRTAPCKTYAGAISKTAKDGEISTLDPGGFGTVTITKSITINGGGAGQGYGSILSALAPQGDLINITDAADVRKTVRLNWLDINGASTGTDGIRFIAGNALHVENCLVDGVVGQGLEVNVAGTTSPKISVNNTS